MRSDDATPDPRPARRIRDPELLRRLHRQWRECALAYTDAHDTDPERQLSLHHLSKHPRHDLEENLVMLCGSGTTGCHGRAEHHHPATKQALREYLEAERPDSIAFLDAGISGP